MGRGGGRVLAGAPERVYPYLAVSHMLMHVGLEAAQATRRACAQAAWVQYMQMWIRWAGADATQGDIPAEFRALDARNTDSEAWARLGQPPKKVLGGVRAF